jgi:copper oxidase (laccase) domain-containing protein
MSGLAWDDGDVPRLRWASAPPGVGVAFTSRRGGVSDGPFRSLNLGALTADAAANVAENRRRDGSSSRAPRRSPSRTAW